MADEAPESKIAVWVLVAPVECVWTPVTPSAGDGELDFSDPDNSGLEPAL
jgi:hypothetical protein